MSVGNQAAGARAGNRFKKWRRRLMMKTGHAVTRGIARFEAAQSQIGDPPIADNSAFPFVTTLESNWQRVRDEAVEIIKFRSAIPLFEEISTDQKSISRESTWRTFFLYGFGEPIARSCK